MIVGKKLNIKKEKNLTNEIDSFLNPKYVYIPLVSGSDKNITLIVKKGDYVYKGSIIGKSKGNFRIPIHSSVSGMVIDFVEKTYLDGTKVKCVKIENDFKEQSLSKYETVNTISKYSKEDFIKVLQECGVIGMGGAGFPTYVKYNTDKKINTLIVNAVECEPYITSDIVLLKNNMEELLEAIDAVIEINGIKEGIIAIKKSSELIKKFNNYLGTYPKIKVVEVNCEYTSGWERDLIMKIKKVDYYKLPLEKGIVVNNVSTIFAIYEALKYHKPLVERIVTVTGECINKPKNVLVKTGTLASDILKKLGEKIDDNALLIAGGPMMGNEVEDKDLIISANNNCILLMNPIKNNEVVNCIRCGKCTNICPAHLSPVLIKDSIKDLNKLKKLKANRCMECGLCSYACPSKIRLRELVKEAKDKIESEGK